MTLTLPQPDITAFANELTRQHFAKRDFVADASDVQIETSERTSHAFLRGIDGAYEVTPHAHGQIAGYCDIPLAYYNRMRQQAPELYDQSVNTWLGRHSGQRRMIRTLDGKARAFLSDRFKRLDNYDLANVVLPVLAELGATIRNLEVTETRMYIKAAFGYTGQEFDNPVNRQVGDRIFMGVAIRNSEVGAGQVEVLPMSLILSCLNGATHNEYAQKRRHVGGRIGDDKGSTELYSDETLAADDRAFMLKIRDTVRAAGTDVMVGKIIEQMNESIGNVIKSAPSLAVEELGRTRGLTSTEQEGILDHLIAGGSYTQWGMVNAVTRYAQDVTQYDRRDELEQLGGDILAMARSEFGPIANARERRASR